MRLLPLPGVLQPPSDAWMVVDHLRRERLSRDADVLDLCAGSGVLGLAAALEGAARVTAVDVSRRAVGAIRLHAALNRVRVEAIRGDLFDAVRGRRFDLIISNPPYVPGDVSQLPNRGLARAWEGGRSGRAFIERIAAGAADHLNPGGVLLLVCSSVCGERAILDLLRAGRLDPSVVVRRRGPLGPRLSARANWLRSQGRLLDGDEEEILVFRAALARPAGSAFPSRARLHSTSSRVQAPDLSAPTREGAL